MPSVSQAQQHFMAGWEHNPESMHGTKPNMTHQQFHDFAATKTGNLPEHVAPKKHGLARLVK
jgi:hypothetical protein